VQDIGIHIFAVLALIDGNLLLNLLLRIVTHPAILQILMSRLFLPSFPHIMISIYGKLPPLLLVLMLLMLAHIERLVVLSGQLLLRPQLVPDRLVDPSPTACPLDIRGVETPHIGLIMRDCILEGVFFWAGEDPVLFNLGMIKFRIIVFAANLCEVILASRDLGRKLLGFAIEPGSVRQVALLEEGTGLVV